MGIRIKQSEALEATSILTHLRQLFIAVTYTDDHGEIRYKRPIIMDDGQLIQCAASLRTLLFDKNPVLLNFVSKHKMDVHIDCLETDLNLLLLSCQTLSQTHISDFFVAAICDPEMSETIPLNKTMSSMYGDFDDQRDHRFINNKDRWLPDIKTQEASNSMVSINPSNGRPLQFINFTKRRTTLDKWGNEQIGVLKERPMRRKNLIEYTANWLGGVHYNSKRHSDTDEYRLLCSAMDWDNQAFMHAALVATAVSSIEIMQSPIIKSLLDALSRFYVRRKERLAKGISLE